MSDPRASVFKPWSALARLSARRPVSALAALTVAAVVAALYAGMTLSVSSDTSELISADVPYRQNALDYRAAFDRTKDQVVTVVEAQSQEEADRAAFALYERLRAAPEFFAGVEAPDFDPFFVGNGLLYRSTEELERLGDALAGAQAFLTSVAERPGLDGLAPPLIRALEAVEAGRAEADQLAPVLQGLAATAQAAATDRPRAMVWSEVFGGEAKAARRFIVFTPVLAKTRFSRAKPALNAYGEALDAVRAAHPQATFRATGEPLIRVAEVDSVLDGMTRAGLASLLGVAIILAFGVRSGGLSVGLVLSLILGLALTIGLGALTVGRLNLISVAFVVLFIGLSVDFGVHFGLRALEERRRGVGPVEAAGAAASHVGGPLALAALCAGAGFLSFLPTAYDGLAELGVIAAGGMAVALLVNLIGPSAVLPISARKPAGKLDRPKEDRILERRAGIVTALFGISGLAGLMVATGVRVDLNPLNLAPRTEAVAVYESLSTDARSNPYTASVLVNDANAARRTAADLQDEPLVAETRTLASLLPDEQDDKLLVIEDLSFFAPPPLAERRDDPTVRYEAAADLVAALEAAPAALAEEADRLKLALLALEGEELARFETDAVAPLARIIAVTAPAPALAPLSLADIPERLRRRWVAPDGRWRVEAVPAEDLNDADAMARFSDAVLALEPTATGAPVSVTEAGRVVGGAFLTATLISLGAVTLFLALSLRDLAAVALTLMTPALAAIWTGAGAAMLDVPFNFANVIVLPLLFGLGASASIHMVARHRRGTVDEDLHQSSTPRAVMVSALTTLASFGSLLLSEHRGMQSMGMLLTIAIVAILAASLLALPAFLALTDRLAKARPA